MVATLVDACRERAENSPERVCHEFYADGEDLKDSLTFAELDTRAKAVAADLRGHAPAGSTAMLRHAPGTEFIVGFFGCLYAGITAIPSTPLGSMGNKATSDRAAEIARNARPRLLLSSGPELARAVEQDEHRVGELAMTPVDTALVEPDLARHWSAPEIDGDTAAYLQYSSGSTGAPKGVRLSHANVLHNLGLIVDLLGVHRDSPAVSWLPMFHDMGLIAGGLVPVAVGNKAKLMSPAAFLQHPQRWLALLNDEQTHTAAPNFAYDLCARRTTTAQLGRLDLSGVRNMIIGAEPVRAGTLRRFAETFAAAGLREAALLPCFGMAEATLLVTGGPAGKPPVIRKVDPDGLRRGVALPSNADDPAGQDVVGCGEVPPGMRVLIADPDGTGVLEPDRIGEICVQGPSVGGGYHDSPETEQTFGTRLDGVGGLVLRTGDLGWLEDGQLFVAGRLTDLLVIDGSNHHPADLEAALAGLHEALYPERAAVISADVGDRERVVVLAELTPKAARKPESLPEGGFRAVGSAIRGALSGTHGVPVHDVVLLPPGRLPYTSSGKLQRPICRTRYLDGEFEAIRIDNQPAAARPASEVNA